MQSLDGSTDKLRKGRHRKANVGDGSNDSRIIGETVTVLLVGIKMYRKKIQLKERPSFIGWLRNMDKHIMNFVE